MSDMLPQFELKNVTRGEAREIAEAAANRLLVFSRTEINCRASDPNDQAVTYTTAAIREQSDPGAIIADRVRDSFGGAAYIGPTAAQHTVETVNQTPTEVTTTTVAAETTPNILQQPDATEAQIRANVDRIYDEIRAEERPYAH